MAASIRLLISLYPIENRERLDEITECLRRNLALAFIGSVTVLDEGFPRRDLLDHPKVTLCPMNRRPDFADFYPHLDPDGFNLLANNDIFFDRTLRRLRRLVPGRNDLIVLTRTEPDGTLYRARTGDAQDAWIARGRPETLRECVFPMGFPGCENRLSFLFFRNGWRVLNPARVIRARHMHASESRTYTPDNRIAGDYLSTRPVGLLGFHFLRLTLKILHRSRLLRIKELVPAQAESDHAQ